MGAGFGKQRFWGRGWRSLGTELGTGDSGVEPESLGCAWELKEQIGRGVWKAKIEAGGDDWGRSLKCCRGLWRCFVVLEQGLKNWGRGVSGSEKWGDRTNNLTELL